MRTDLDERTRGELERLDAVKRVDGNRIVYADHFRRSAMEAYRNGMGPVALFRRAGLGPERIGYKRIERCMARWRRAEGRAPGKET